MGLNNGQSSALYNVMQAWQGGQGRYFLSGPPGSGKTFTTGDIVRAIHEAGADIAFVASTNAAMLNAQNRAIDDKWITLVSYWGTAHRLLGLRYDPRQDATFQTSHGIAHRFDVVIVDESSPLHVPIVNMLLDKCRFVLFVGDQDQLTPVGENISSAFYSNGSTLTEIVRQDDKAMLAAIMEARTAVRRKNFDEFDYSLLDSFAIDDLIGWQNQLTGAPDEMALCFTNDESLRLNRIVRARMGYAEEYCVDDRIIFAAPLYRRGKRGAYELVYPTNAIVTVRAAEQLRYKGFPLWSLTVEGKIGQPGENEIAVYDTTNLSWIQFLHEVTPEELWPHVAETRHAYALTTHRAMGGEWPTVHVQMRDFSRCWDDRTKTRLLYVALSRAREKLNVLMWPGKRRS